MQKAKAAPYIVYCGRIKKDSTITRQHQVEWTLSMPRDRAAPHRRARAEAVRLVDTVLFSRHPASSYD